MFAAINKDYNLNCFSEYVSDLLKYLRWKEYFLDNLFQIAILDTTYLIWNYNQVKGLMFAISGTYNRKHVIGSTSGLVEEI